MTIHMLVLQFMSVFVIFLHGSLPELNHFNSPQAVDGGLVHFSACPNILRRVQLLAVLFTES